jgi:hypothetical protein
LAPIQSRLRCRISGELTMKPDEVKQLVHRGVKDERISYWLQPKHYDNDQFREDWDRIGRGDLA